MNEPTRFSDGPPDQVESLLLRSMQADAIPKDARRRMLVTLGLTGAVGSAATSAGASAAGAGLSAKLLLALKWLSVAVVAGGAVVGVVTQVPRWTGSATEATMPAASSSVNAASPTTAAPLAASVGSPTNSATPLEPAAPTTRKPTARASAESKKSRLADEIAALDRVRVALGAGNGSRALSELGRYHRSFPRGRLGAEAMVLRIQALMLNGNRSAARQLAKRFLSANPRSPLGPRVRSLVGLPEPAGRNSKP